MTEHQHTGPGGHHSHHNHHLNFDAPETAAFAEREAETLAGILRQAVARLAAVTGEQALEVRRLIDIGCGPGVGTCALAEQFPSATVLAADGSQPMLDRVVVRAARLGVAPQVETRRVDLPAGLETLGSADVLWASMVVHHLGDEVDALRRIRELLEPGGLLALVERAAPLRISPADDDLGRPGLWPRLDTAADAWFAEMRAELPDAMTSADYPGMLAEAGFELLVDDVLTVVVEPPLDVEARRFAHDHLVRTRQMLDGLADAADLEALDTLVDEHADGGVLRRDDVEVRASRRLYLARAAGEPDSA